MTPCLGPNAKLSSVCQPPPPISSPVPASSLFSGTAARVHFNTVFSITLMHTNVSTLEAASDCCSDVWIKTCRQHFSHNEPDVLLSNTSPDWYSPQPRISHRGNKRAKIISLMVFHCRAQIQTDVTNGDKQKHAYGDYKYVIFQRLFSLKLQKNRMHSFSDPFWPCFLLNTIQRQDIQRSNS